MDKNDETLYCQFVIDKIESAGGCLKLQHISGHLSQLDDDVRRAVGTKPVELIRFLRNHADVFVVEKNNMVRLKKSECDSNFDRNDSKFDRNDSNLDRNYSYSNRNDPNFDRNDTNFDRSDTNFDRNDNSESLFPKYLKDQKGIVIKVLPNFGFISSKKPKTSVYFTPACFKDGDKKLLTDLVEPGKKVCFNARRGDAKFESKYQATSVWIPENVENEVLHPEGFKKHKKTIDTGLYDAPTSEGFGKIQKVFKDFGFIIIDNDPKNTVYFTKKNVCNVENILDLTKVMNINDPVEYKAVRSKKDCKTRWQANKVWLRGHGKSHLSKKEIALNNQRENNQKFSREFKRNEPGKIYPNTNGTVIKFGAKLEHLADADSCLFYMHGMKVSDVCWEFSDADNVTFDAIKIKSAPGWKALISWVGTRPDIVLSEDLGDFSGCPDEDIDDIPDTESVTSKTSGISTSSEISHNSSGISRNRRSASSSRAQNYRETPSPSFHRDSRESKRSDFRNATARSMSRSSKSSQHSNSNAKNSQKSKPSMDHANSDGSSAKTFKKPRAKYNSKSDERHQRTFKEEHNRFQSRFENDSGFGSDHCMNRERKDSYYEKNTKHTYGNNVLATDECSEEDTKYLPSKPLIKSDSPKKPSQKLESKSKTYTNWGDSPYPDEVQSDADEEDIVSEVCEETSKIPSGNQKSSHSKSDNSDEEILSNDEYYESEEDFENTVSEIENKNPKIDVKEKEKKFPEVANKSDIESIFEEPSKEDQASLSEEPQVRPYIKHFRGLSGNVLRVYCKYAEIENERLKKSASFFWTDLYCNGRPAPDHFEDLNEVLREGQTINFNCIEIVDDSGSCWHKITMAWKGVKPRIKEMTAAEYISDNRLIVTASEESNETTDSFEDPLEQQKPAAPARKFLTLAVESEEDDDDDEEEEEEEKKEEESLPVSDHTEATAIIKSEPSDCNGQVPLCDVGDVLQESSSPASLMQLTEIVGKMFLSYRHSEVDVNVIASDVVTCVLRRAGKLSALTSAAVNSCHEKESQTETVSLVAAPVDSSVSRKVDLTETSMQTIITGDVIAQSIFTQ